MAIASVELVVAIRETADRLEGGVRYQWAHMGHCNCGHLAQTLTRLPGRKIHEVALEAIGDWTEQVEGYCAETGASLESIVKTMVAAGLTTIDIANLERLLDDEVLGAIPADRLPLDHRVREDAVLYLRTWADVLERRWIRATGRRLEQTREKSRPRSEKV